MLRPAVKVVASIVASLIGIPVAFYVAALLVNWRDQPPSPDAVRLAASYESRPPLADNDNAYIYLLGFDAPLADDPREVGARRFAWLQSANSPLFGRADDPQSTHLEHSSTDTVVEQFLAACENNDTRECALAFTEGGVVFRSWNATHPWLLERYLALTAYSGWRENAQNVLAPLPSYAPALRAQRLLLLQAKVFADDGNTRAASEILARDVRFWRIVLASADSLVTKMIATAALRQHFAWGSLAVRSFPSESVATELPNEWHQAMTDAELSLRRVLVGEWVFFANMPVMDYADLDLEQTFAAGASQRLVRPLFQHQATLNQHAAYLAEMADTVDVPLSEYPHAAERASQLAQRTADEALPPRSLYNLVGSLMMSVGPPDYGAYARRVGDLEGMRRGALATALLRGRATSTSQISEALAASSLRNPYDDAPLQWDAEEQAVVFVGLEPGQRGEHRYYY